MRRCFYIESITIRSRFYKELVVTRLWWGSSLLTYLLRNRLAYVPAFQVFDCTGGGGGMGGRGGWEGGRRGDLGVGGMSRGACGRDSGEGRGRIEDSGRVSGCIWRGIKGAFVGFVQPILGLLEGILGSSGSRAFLFFFSHRRARQLIQVVRVLLFGSQGSARKEGSRSFWIQWAQYFEAIKGFRL